MEFLKKIAKNYQKGMQHPIESMKEFVCQVMSEDPEIETVALTYGIATDIAIVAYAIRGAVYARKLKK